jgi:hypothetical protein
VNPIIDGTLALLKEIGLPLTRENYLMLAFAGKPPQEPLDGEIEAELPKEFQMDRGTEEYWLNESSWDRRVQ